MAEARRRVSPNHGPRRGGARPDIIVIHYTAMAGPAAALDRLCDPTAQVSAHYLIAAGGDLWQLVDEEARAWHAGAGAWGGCADVNSRSIGIELDNSGQVPFAGPQMQALEEVLRGLMARWPVPPERVLAHSDIAPGRKHDPGPRFDWRRLARQGLSVWPGAGVPGGRGAAELLARIGYTAPASAGARLAAFRSRFRPGACGPLTEADLACMADLADRYPVDGALRSA